VLIAFINSLETGIRIEIRERSEAVITDIAADISDMWKALHHGEAIENVRLYLPDEDKAIDIALRLLRSRIVPGTLLHTPRAAPVYERVASEFEPEVRFLKVDTSPPLKGIFRGRLHTSRGSRKARARSDGHGCHAAR
jgi:hypothetical protein